MRRFLFIAPLLLMAACSTSSDRLDTAQLQSPHMARLSQIVAAIKSHVPGLDGGVIAGRPAQDAAPALPALWRVADSDLYLGRDGPAQSGAVYYFPGLGARQTRISLHNLQSAPLKATLICDAEARVVGDGRGAGHMRPNRPKVLTLPGLHETTLRLVLGPEVGACDITWGNGARLLLLREEVARPELARIDQRQDLCDMPDPARLDPLAKAFYADRWMSQTCVTPLGEITLLPDSLDALNARIMALTGQKMTRAQLYSGNPDQPLDFSNAPDLDLIYLSYLHIRADYSGHLLLRMLEHHAAKGTIIRILVTDVLTLGIERRVFGEFAGKYPNVQLQLYRWDAPGILSVGEFVETYQNAQHIKVFAVISPDLGRSSAIVGGRNIHDGFFFDRTFDMSTHADIRDYQDVSEKSLAFLSFYEDFEVVMHDDDVVASIAAQLSTFWHRDSITLAVRPLALNGSTNGLAKGGLRHFMSLPWVDGYGQEAFFIDLLDAAESKIVLVSPYLSPVVGIENALHRARARGVEVLFVSRVMSTDPPGIFTAALAREFIDRCGCAFDIFRYETDNLLLHSKIMLIDNRLAVITSSNQNAQSFRNDTENGIVVLDRDFTSRIQEVVDGYIKGATLQETVPDLSFLSHLFRAMPWLKRVF